MIKLTGVSVSIQQDAAGSWVAITQAKTGVTWLAGPYRENDIATLRAMAKGGAKFTRGSSLGSKPAGSARQNTASN